jgi:hypothetical protein
MSRIIREHNRADLDSAKHFTQTGNEQVVNDIISKLRYIAKVKSGEKLNVKELFVRDNNEIWQRFLRTMRNGVLWEDGESKESTLAFLTSVTDEALNLICFYRKEVDNEFNNNIADMLTRNLEDALKGMESIIDTYKDNRIFSSQIETMMGTLTLRLKAFNGE